MGLCGACVKGRTPSMRVHASQQHQQWVLAARVAQRSGHCFTVQTAVTWWKVQQHLHSIFT